MGELTRWRPHPDAMRFVPMFIGVNLVGSLNLALFPVWLTHVGLDAPSLGPSEGLRARFTERDPGRWLYHCHVMTHMEQGMVGFYDVSP